MHRRQLGRTGIEGSACCPGATMFGPNGNPHHDACARIVHRFPAGRINGINLVDPTP
ncbi:hypothetical protein [Kitasatospora sp. NPDC056181]|uniref:hypothetical protein n=1 Tax=Kitasatospora sp. NPDC056181 TaxID=3345737 RepID=UPI0035E29311